MYPAIRNYFTMDWIPAAATFSYGQPSICADLSDQLPYLSNFQKIYQSIR